MSSYQQEYLRGHEDGYEKGLQELKTYDDNEITVNETLSQLFKHLGINNPKLVKKCVGYVMAEANA